MGCHQCVCTWHAHTSAHAWRAQDVRFIARLNKLKLAKKTFLPALGLKQCSLKQLLWSRNNLLCSNYGNMPFSIRHLCFTSARDPGTPAPPFLSKCFWPKYYFFNIMAAVLESAYYAPEALQSVSTLVSHTLQWTFIQESKTDIDNWRTCGKRR